MRGENVKLFEGHLFQIGLSSSSPIFSTPSGRHEPDSRQSQSRSGKISKVSRRRFAGFRLKLPFSFVKAAGKLRLGTTLNETPAVHFFTFQRSGRGMEETQKMTVGERQRSVGILST
jgi:hypothetical protein